MNNNRAVKKNIVMTIALPYANGPIHIGHLVEAVQADARARILRMLGNKVIFLCADDNHGTPIEIKAAEVGTTPEALIEAIGEDHRRDYRQFSISFDAYHKTHSDENRAICEQIYRQLKANGHIKRNVVSQLFDPQQGRFLADRHVSGTCPKCSAADQYGDHCEACGSTYSALDLQDPRSRLSGSIPEVRSSEHLFLSLIGFQPFLEKWAADDDTLQPAVRAKLKEWFDAGLKDWDISRDAPYFGFEIPGEPGKYFYVWMDAPIGYLAALESYCQKNGGSWRDYWKLGADAELHHFIGKDIALFHTCFWPCLLHGSGYRTPTKVHCHGFLTVNGSKMSKSRGTLITAETFAHHLDPDTLRYFLLSQLRNNISDIDFSIDEFTRRIDSELVGKIVNIASRCFALLKKVNGGVLSESFHKESLYADLISASKPVLADLEYLETASAVRRIVAMADDTNRFIDRAEPWNKLADPEIASAIVSQGLLHFRAIAILLQPITPDLARRSLALFGEETERQLSPDSIETPPFGSQIVWSQALLKRIDPGVLDVMIEQSKTSASEEA